MRTNGLDRNGLNNYPANNTLNVFLDLCLPCMETLCTDILLNTEELLDWWQLKAFQKFKFWREPLTWNSRNLNENMGAFCNHIFGIVMWAFNSVNYWAEYLQNILKFPSSSPFSKPCCNKVTQQAHSIVTQQGIKYTFLETGSWNANMQHGELQDSRSAYLHEAAHPTNRLCF